MKDSFLGYYHPTDDELDELWKNGVFFFDANVLLNLYRYPKNARDDLLKVLRQISSRLWLPHQAALEYQQNRLSVIAEQLKKYDDVRKVLTDALNNLSADLASLQLKKRHSTINPDELLEKVKAIFNDFTKNLSVMEKEQPDVYSEDELRTRIDSLFKDRIGQPCKTQEELDILYEDGKIRYEAKIPPGYADSDKSKVKEGGQSFYIYNNLIIKREYGDFLVWSQIIEEAKNRSLKHVIFVTDDEKEDWWWFVESKGKKTIGPRPELVQEIVQKAQVSNFHMYNSERFLEFAQKYLKTKIKKETIDQVREVAQIKRATSSTTSLGQFNISAIESAVGEWLIDFHAGYDVNRSNTGYPDFIVNVDNKKIGYEIKYLHGDNFQFRLRRILQDSVYKAHYEIDKGRFSSIRFVLVMDDESQLHPIVNILSSPRTEIPTGIAFVLGKIITVDEQAIPSKVKFVHFLEFEPASK